MSVDVVVVNWNSGAQLRACVESVLAFGDRLVGKIIVVDNGSTDDSLNFLNSLNFLQSGGGITLIRAGENLGFARACNRGAAKAESEYLLFLNPDARVMPGTLGTVCDYMNSEAAKTVGICGVKLIGENGSAQRHCVRFPGWRTYMSSVLGLSAVFPRYFPSHFMREFDHQDSRRVDHVMGAFFFVRRKLFEYLCGFDEQFFVYLEDLDFSLRARNAGWSTYYLAEATVFHKGGGTSEQVKAQRLFYSIRSRILYSYKHFSRPAAFFLLITTLFVEPVSRLVLALSRRSGDMALETLQGFALLWRDLPNILRTVILSGR